MNLVAESVGKMAIGQTEYIEGLLALKYEINLAKDFNLCPKAAATSF